MKNNVLIIGAGGVGGYIGYLFEKIGYDVSIIMKDSHQSILQVFDENVCYDVEFKGISKQEVEIYKASFPTIVVATKKYDIQEALKLSEDLIADDGKIIILQNGLHNYNIPLSIEHNIIKGVIYIVSERIGTQIIKSSSFCKIILEDSGLQDLNNNLKKLNSEVLIEKNIEKVIWEKFIHIASYSGIICYLGLPIGEIKKEQEYYLLYKNLLNEIYEIALEQGYCGEKGLNEYERITLNTNDTAFCSLYYDLEKGGKNEFDGILGSLQSLSKKLEKKYPTIDIIYEKIKGKYFL